MAKNNLKSILEQEGIKQTELAKAIDLSTGMINKVCNKKYDPAPTSKHKILHGVNRITGREYGIQDVFPNSKG